MYYEIMYIKGINREFVGFTNKTKAKKEIKKLLKEGAINIFLDTYYNEEDMELINYEEVIK